MSTHEDIDALLARIREHGGIVPDTAFALLQLHGKDALDLIHRLSTNDLRMCRPGVPVATVFTTEKGRIIDRVEITPHDDGLWMVCHRAARERLLEWITKYTITEEVEVADVTAEYIMLSVITGDVHSTITLTGQIAVPGNTQPWRSAFGPHTMFRLVVRIGASAGVIARLQEAGVHTLTDAEFRDLRVACGVPSFPEELNDAHNPLESGLRNDISFTKGCYIGQEVIARLDSYDKVQQALVVLAVRAEGAMIPLAAPIGTLGGIVGAVTTAGGMLSGLPEAMVMGYVARRVIDEAAPLTVETDAGSAPARILGAAGSYGFSGSVGA